jgi:hypothetical protein
MLPPILLLLVDTEAERDNTSVAAVHIAQCAHRTVLPDDTDWRNDHALVVLATATLAAAAVEVAAVVAERSEVGCSMTC